MPVRPTMRRPA